MLGRVQSQAYYLPVIDMNSVLSLDLYTLTENIIHYIHCMVERAM